MTALRQFVLITTAVSLLTLGCDEAQWADIINAIGHHHGSTDDPAVCVYNGDEYDIGETFEAADGCNSCGCNEDGQVVCTEMYCYNGCEWDGVFYDVGAVIGDPDGCNYCYCEADGYVWCTDADCVNGCYDQAGAFHEVGDAFNQECNSCYCMDDGAVECTLMDCAPGCYVDGAYHAVGETFMEGCSPCVCGDDGTAACETQYCPD